MDGLRQPFDSNEIIILLAKIKLTGQNIQLILSKHLIINNSQNKLESKATVSIKQFSKEDLEIFILIT